jgi:single-strand DNA-binding protein
MINRVTLVGRLTRDPEMHSSAKGTLVAKLRLATNEYARDDEGNRQDSVEYHSAVAFGKLAGVCKEFVTRGKLLYLEGRLRTREWEGKDGFRRYTTEIVVDILQMLSPRAGAVAPEVVDGPDAPEPPGPIPEAHSRRGRRVAAEAGVA